MFFLYQLLLLNVNTAGLLKAAVRANLESADTIAAIRASSAARISFVLESSAKTCTHDNAMIHIDKARMDG